PATSAVTGRHSNQLNYRSLVGVANVTEIAIQAKTKMPDGVHEIFSGPNFSYTTAGYAFT
ncbi:MAG: hypothetical protein V4676_10000, partial [Bacteroidota bacterium]